MIDGTTPFHVIQNGTLYARHVLPSLANGTRLLADVFWLCDDDQQVKETLPANWTGICAPVMLTGQIVIFAESRETKTDQTRARRSVTGLPQKTDDNIYIAWNQEPMGVPGEHHAISEHWIKSGQATGWLPVVGPIINSQWLARNSRWVNFLWYNQQRFMNWTISSFDNINLQLHSTTKMALQNRFALDRILAEELGVCSHFGDDCCTVIPTVTGENGNLTLLLNKMKSLRDQHVTMSNWNTKNNVLAKIWDWLGSLSWTRIFRLIGMLLGGFLLLVMVLMCCILPLVSAMIKRATRIIPGQFLLQIQQNVNPIPIDRDEYTYENMTDLVSDVS